MTIPSPSSFDAEHEPMSLGDMDPQEFRRYGYQAVDWIADYLTNIRGYPVLSQVAPGEIQQLLPQTAPHAPESMQDILADFDTIIMPGITHWNAPGFLAYYSMSGSGPGIIGEMLSNALNVNAMLWRTSPAATELEQVTVDWLRQMLGLPAPLFGFINDTASSGILVALAAAREAQSDLAIHEQGMAGRTELPRLCLYTSQEAHSSVDKAAIVLGIGQENVRKIATDDDLRLDPVILEQTIQQDIAAGYRPFAVIATIGTTSTSSIDPIPPLVTICQKYNLWLHVDASYGGAAAIDPEMRWVLAGCEQADSLIINPHKWVFTQADCSILYTRKPELIKAAFSLVPEFLRSTDQHDESIPNLMEYGIALGRRFRALKLWMVLRYFGQDGLAARIREHRRLAQLLRQWMAEDPEVEIMAPTLFSLVCFRLHPQNIDDENTLNMFNETFMNRINANGHFFLSHTKIDGKLTLRIAIGNIHTNEEDIQQLWGEIQRKKTEVKHW
jgi:aromatic-L-amino-acid decarboxylase